LPPGRGPGGRHALLELARHRRRQRARAGPGRLHPGDQHRGKAGRAWPSRSAPAVHPPVSARTDRRGVDHGEPEARRLHEGTGDSVTVATLPRVGFLGVGWIGRMRMQSLLSGGLVLPAGVADSDPAALAAAPTGSERVTTLEELLE